MHFFTDLVANHGRKSEAGDASRGETPPAAEGSRHLLRDARVLFIRRDEFFVVAFCIADMAR